MTIPKMTATFIVASVHFKFLHQLSLPLFLSIRVLYDQTDMTMKRLAFLLASLFISLSAFSQMVRENPVAGCKITKDYGTISVTYYLSCSVHLAKEGEFADLKINTQRKSKFGQSVANQLIECSLRFVFLWGRANEIPPRSQTAQEFSYHLITPVTGVNFLLNGSVSVICVILHSSR